eukprot:10261352-Karenia_brevis.AAC.1
MIHTAAADLANVTGPVIGPAAMDMSGPRQSGAYNVIGTAPLDLEESPRSNLQLPKIGTQGASASAAIVPKGPSSPGQRQ